jgi:hypothetical protein
MTYKLNSNNILGTIISAFLFFTLACTSKNNDSGYPKALVPHIDGDWWQVAGNPDLGELTSEDQQPVDFGIWQAADGTWQIWSCIRKTKEKGNTRLFYRWEGKSIEQQNWEPKGIAMRGETLLGEAAGGLQAPFVIKNDGKFYMFYGDWNRICLAASDDGKLFERVLRNGSPALFGDLSETNTRDPMLILHKDLWYCYYTAHPDNDGAIYVRTSEDFYTWSASTKVAYGGSPGKGKLWFAECPHVIQLEKDMFFLFRTYSYGNYQSGKLLSPPKTNVYLSKDPYDFGIDSDKYLVTQLPVAAPEIVNHDEKWYIASLMPDLQGIRIARLTWEMR